MQSLNADENISISISQTPLSQDDELALMVGYAAAMDASMSEGSSSQDMTAAVATGASSPPDESEEPQEGPSGIGRPPEDWESQTGEELNHTSLSMCVSEATCKKSRGERTLTDYLTTRVTVDVVFVVNHTLRNNNASKAELEFSPIWPSSRPSVAPQ